jgi:hypothetical protein
MIGSEQSDRLVEMVQATFARGGTVKFQARGRSMEPTVGDGALVAIAAIERAPIRVGDVVLCRGNGDSLVLHRLVRLESGWYLSVRGDAPSAQPDRIPREALLGRAIGVLENGRMRRLDGAVTRLRVLARRALHRLRRAGPLRPSSRSKRGRAEEQAP